MTTPGIDLERLVAAHPAVDALIAATKLLNEAQQENAPAAALRQLARRVDECVNQINNLLQPVQQFTNLFKEPNHE